MSLRLISTKVAERRPLWWDNGVPFYLPQGNAPDDDDKDKDKDGGEDDDSADDKAGSDDSGSADQGDDDGSADGTVDKEEHDRVVARMKAADRRAADLQKQVDDRKRQESTELENAKADLQAAQDRATKAEKDLSDLRIQNAFLRSNTIKWHNPERALQMADLSGVAIDDDGKVDRKALEQALKDLAKSDAYLVNTDADDGRPGRSGETVGGGRQRSKDDKTNDETLRRRFPALASRG